MGKKQWIIILGIVLVLIAAGSTWFAIAAQDPAGEKLAQLGEVDHQGTDETGSIAYQGDHVEIRQSDLDFMIQRLSVTAEHPEEVEDAALKVVALRQIFCYRAEQAGIANDDNEFASWLEDYQKSIESASNYEDFIIYTTGREMTVEEYWTWAKTDPSFRREWYSNLFVNQLYSDFQQEHQTSDSSETLQDAWNAYLADYKEQAFQEEHLIAVSAEKE